MKRVALILPIWLLILGCASQRVVEMADPLVVERVDLADGVNWEEAQRIALRYFEEFHGLCGGMEFTEETEREWHFGAVVGFGATPMPPIIVSKDGRRISQKGSPTVVYSNGEWRYRGRDFFGRKGRG